MNTEISMHARNRQPDAFDERLRKALAHDLRTPLGTIANYAAILEFHGSANTDDVHAFAGRIRLGAGRLATMLQQMSDALAISTSAARRQEVDLSGLLRAQLSALGLQGNYPASGHEPAAPVRFDAAILGFAWRAFLSVCNEAAPLAAFDLDIDIESTAAGTWIELWIGPRPGGVPLRIGLEQFAQTCSDTTQPLACFALGLAEALIERRGGSMELWGQPGAGASLRLGLARTG